MQPTLFLPTAPNTLSQALLEIIPEQEPGDTHEHFLMLPLKQTNKKNTLKVALRCRDEEQVDNVRNYFPVGILKYTHLGVSNYLHDLRVKDFQGD